MKSLLQNKSNWLFLNALVLIIIGLGAQLVLGWTSFVGPIFLGLALGILIGAVVSKMQS